MEQVFKTAVLWVLGSRNPAADCARIQQIPRTRRRSAVVIHPLQPVNMAGSAVIGRTFEDRVLNDVMPIVASNLGVLPVGRLCRVTRHVAHCGDFAIHYQGRVGLIELKNHARSLPVTDRRRFFDALLINCKNIDWAILVTSRCSVPHFGEKGYTVVGQLVVPKFNKQIPVAFVCGIDILGPNSLELAIRAVCDGQSALVGPQWNCADLIERGEATRALESSWGSGDSQPFLHPPGAIF